jgi:predicted RNase H-like nuclease (RuvC/YqgF family)
MPRDEVHPSDYAFLEGRILRIESEQKTLRRIHEGMTEQIESLTQALRRLREENSHWEPWRETTDVRNMRRVELESLRARAKDADEAENSLARAKGEMVRKIAWLAPALGTLLYALSELIRSFIHH